MNTLIGNPFNLFEEYTARLGYRRLDSITEEECRVILNLACDNGDFNGIAVNHLKILSAASNFVEGNVSFGGGETYYFIIGHDATVEIHRMEFDAKATQFVHTKNRMKINCFSRIVFYMMRRGFDLHSDLQ